METQAQTKYSKKLIKEWHSSSDVGIWGERDKSIRLYEDRAIYKYYYTKWVGNSGTLAEGAARLDGSILQKLLTLAEQEVADEADYTRHAFEIASGM